MRSWWMIVALVACKSDEEAQDLFGSAPKGSAGSAVGSGSGSSGGFAAQLGADLRAGSGSAGSGSAGSGSGSDAGIEIDTGPTGLEGHAAVKPPPELAAIAMTLPAKWGRDLDTAGTILRVREIDGKPVAFRFTYGYDDKAAPKDRDAYIKWLAEQKLLLPAHADKPLLNRQRGAAWYLEGVDGSGAGAFRYLINYGDKKLVCGGPMYREAGLGKLRDEVIIQAKAICESLTLP